jgi:hypothetical protein
MHEGAHADPLSLVASNCPTPLHAGLGASLPCAALLGQEWQRVCTRQQQLAVARVAHTQRKACLGIHHTDAAMQAAHGAYTPNPGASTVAGPPCCQRPAVRGDVLRPAALPPHGPPDGGFLGCAPAWAEYPLRGRLEGARWGDAAAARGAGTAGAASTQGSVGGGPWRRWQLGGQRPSDARINKAGTPGFWRAAAS